MAIPASTVPAVKSWLFTQLQTACKPDPLGGIDLLVRYGDPGPYDPLDVVSIQGASSPVRPAAFTGGETAQYSFKEEYTLTVVVDVQRKGGGADNPNLVADTQAYALVTQIEDVIRTDPTCGGNVLVARPVSRRESSRWDDNHVAYAVTVTVSISVCAFI